MTLKELAAKGLRYSIGIQNLPPEIEEKVIEGEDIVTKTFSTIVTLMVFDPANRGEKSDEPMVVAKVMACGRGRSQRAAERDGLKECLFRVVL